MRILIGTLLLILGSCACSNSEAAAPELDIKRTMIIDGVISGNGLDDLERILLVESNKEGPDPLNIIINSPGGSVMTAFKFISAMDAARERGLQINCFVPNLAASAAFQIFLHCDQRVVLNNAFLLWHRARVSVGGLFGAPMTSPQAAVIAEELADTDRIILDEVMAALQADPEKVKYHFEAETLHIGSNLAKFAPNFARSYSSVRNLLEALAAQALPRSKQPKGIFGFRKGEIYYMHELLSNMPTNK